MLEQDEQSSEAEPDDPDMTNPAYRIQVTLSPKMLDRRDSRPGDENSALWGRDIGKVDTLQVDGNISRQKRYCFFESHKHEKHKKDKFYAIHKNEEFLTWPDKHNNNDTFNHIVKKETLRKFMVAFCKRWPVQQHASAEKDIEDQYKPLMKMINGFLNPKKETDDPDEKFDAILCRDCLKIAMAPAIAAALEEITINQRWQIVNCFFETCAFVKEHDEAPVFCLEAAGRDDFVVTTYDFAPQQHALFPGVPLQLQSATGLQYTLVLHPHTPKRRLVMLDASLPGDAEE